MELLDNLNENQRKACLETEGPVMVMAGAGSGKTRVLTHRIAHLIEKGVSPFNILAVTFTNKAAREMKERVENLTGFDAKKMWISTFHSFCARFLRIEIENIEGYKKNFIIIDEDDSLKKIKEAMKDLELDTKSFKPQEIIKYISKEKGMISYKISDPYLKMLFPKILDHYNKLLQKDNLLDFDDLILFTVKILEQNPEILNKYQQIFKYIMVDEFQDTNDIQYKLIKLLGMNHSNVFIVGDQDQSIYSFRGAKIENIDKFQQDFKNTKIILLEENYRSTNPILNIANILIKNNDNRIEKNLYTKKESTEKPYLYEASTNYEEIMYILDKIKELHVAGYNYNDFAIIYRMNSLSRQFEDMLVKHQIPYEIYGGISFFERKEVKDMLAYMRLVINHNDNFSFERIVNEPKRKIGPAILDKIKMEAKDSMSWFDAIDSIEQSGIGYNNLIDFKFMILELEEKLSDESDITSILDDIMEMSGYKDMLNGMGEDGSQRLDNIYELKTVLKEADELYEGSKKEKLWALLQDLTLRTNMDKTDDQDSVKLMTVHQAKGLEFKVVFLPALEEGIFPSANSQTFKDLEEERRICYVAITRAKEKLYVSNARSRYLYGMQNMSMPSRFIKEIGKNNFKNISKFAPIDVTIASPSVKIEAQKSLDVIPNEDNNEIKVGDKINHKMFGDGVVVEDSGQVITVAFKVPYGVKKLGKTHPSIRKIN
jgi:DNA helicase-2/ATP-dependent DNA helicase PcrA